MKKALAVIGLVLGSLGCSHAEIVATVRTTAPIEGLKPASKVYLTDTGTKSYDRLAEAFKKAGHEVVERRDDADYFVSIFKLQMLVDQDGSSNYIDLYNLDKFKSFAVPAAVSADDLKVGSADISEAGGRTRGPLDMDAGVISQGARLTGSGTGGFVVGVIGSLGGGLIDRLVSRSDDPPKGIVIARGAITKKGDSSGARFVVGVGSTEAVSPTALFDAALQQYVRTLVDGYAKVEGAS